MTKKRINEIIKTFADDFEVSIVKKGRKYIGVIIDGVDKDNKLVGWFHYGVRHSDLDWCEPATIEPRVIVNRYGEFLCDVPFNFPKNEYFELKYDEEGGYEYKGDIYNVFVIE